jgi:hypothetical protein
VTSKDSLPTACSRCSGGRFFLIAVPECLHLVCPDCLEQANEGAERLTCPVCNCRIVPEALLELQPGLEARWHTHNDMGGGEEGRTDASALADLYPAGMSARADDAGHQHVTKICEILRTLKVRTSNRIAEGELGSPDHSRRMHRNWRPRASLTRC